MPAMRSRRSLERLQRSLTHDDREHSAGRQDGGEAGETLDFNEDFHIIIRPD
jgi:hypothetical protein